MVISGLISLLCLATSVEIPEVEGKKPAPVNIVYILADDLGYRELGCYGQEKIRTPRLDRLASEGMRFMQHYSGNTSNPCCVISPTSEWVAGSGKGQWSVRVALAYTGQC